MSKAIDVSVSPGTSRFAVSYTLAAIGLASTLLLAGCGSAPAEDTTASTQGTEQNTAEESGAPTAAQAPSDASGESAVPFEDWFDVAYEDSTSPSSCSRSRRSRLPPGSMSPQSQRAALLQHWVTLNALREDDDARLKVFVKHDSHQTIAHVQTGHEGDV